MTSIPKNSPYVNTFKKMTKDLRSEMTPGKVVGKALGLGLAVTGGIAIHNAVVGHKTNNSEKVDKLEKELEMLKFQNQLLVKH